jgi:hypothetical protein
MIWLITDSKAVRSDVPFDLEVTGMKKKEGAKAKPAAKPAEKPAEKAGAKKGGKK